MYGGGKGEGRRGGGGEEEGEGGEGLLNPSRVYIIHGLKVRQSHKLIHSHIDWMVGAEVISI